MPITNVLSLVRAQAVIETTRGTAITTYTRYLYPILGGLTWTHEIEHDTTKEHLRGFHLTEGLVPGMSRSRINYEGMVTYEEVVWWLRMILLGNAGALAGSTTGSTPPGYTYTFTPTSTADDLNTFTMIAGDGTNNYEFNRCAVNRATFRWNPLAGGEASWRMALEIFARFEAAGGSFDAPAEVARNRVVAAGTILYSDAIGGTIGTTAVSGSVRSGSIVIDNQLEEKIYSENTTTVAADFGRGEQIVTAEVLVEFANDTEFGRFRAGTNRMLRIQKTGPNIGATPTTDYRVRFDLPVAHLVSFVPGVTGNNLTATLGYVGMRSTTSLQPISVAVVNAISSTAA
jgi:hypothetical protein